MEMLQCSSGELESSGFQKLEMFTNVPHLFISEMIVTHDIRCITRRPDATLSEQQKELISQIGKMVIFPI